MPLEQDLIQQLHPIIVLLKTTFTIGVKDSSGKSTNTKLPPNNQYIANLELLSTMMVVSL